MNGALTALMAKIATEASIFAKTWDLCTSSMLTVHF